MSLKDIKEGQSLLVCFIKATRTLSTANPIANQIFLCELSSKAPYQTLLAYVRHCFLPFSRSLAIPSEEKKDDKKKSTDSLVFNC